MIKKAGLVILIFILTACQKSPQGHVETIGTQQLAEKFMNQETFFFCVSRRNCAYCEKNEVNLEEYVRKHDLTVFLIYSDEDPEAFETLRQKWMPDLNRVPTTYYVQNGKIMDQISGEMDEPVWDTWLIRLQDKTKHADKEKQ